MKINKKFQNVWQLYKDEYAVNAYELYQVKEIFWPIWKCKQSIVVEKEVSLDRFSKILLELIKNGLKKHEEICSFLGIATDSFVTIQLHFLLKYDLIAESAPNLYCLTNKGNEFLAETFQVSQLGVVDIEYAILETLSPSKGEFKPVFFNPKLPIDEGLPENKSTTFAGYRIQQQNFLSQKDQAIRVAHNTRQRPSFAKLDKYRDDFAAFFNAPSKDMSFYDFDNSTFQVQPHFINFSALFYRSIKDPKTVKVDIRQLPNSVLSFTSNVLEENLSKKATQYFQKSPIT